MILLTKEQGALIACYFQKEILETGELGKFSEAIAKAQLKKDIESIEDMANDGLVLSEILQALKKEVNG